MNQNMQHSHAQNHWQKWLLMIVGGVLAVLFVGAIFDVLRAAVFSLLSGVAAVMLPQMLMLWMAQRTDASAAFALWAGKFVSTIILLALIAVGLKAAGVLSATFFISGAAIGVVANIVVLVQQKQEEGAIE